MDDIVQILFLLIFIHVALCSYYYLLYKDGSEKKAEDEMILKLEEKFESLDKFKLVDKTGIPAISNGFHDKFFNNHKFLGWRDFYLKNQSNHHIDDDKNFDGTMVKNYLTTQENVINYITPDELKIR